jgi:hypothetical protein
MNDRRTRAAAAWVFLILLGSFAFFWHSRDWNTGTRLMLTYALGDRATIALDGLEGQTNDRAVFRGHSYTDKQPGLSLLALPSYLLSKVALRLDEHPRGHPAIAHWSADYWVTLATSGLSTALAGSLLTLLSARLGCGPRRAGLVGLAYGLATPAYVYATLAYGHQTAAFFLLSAFALIWTGDDSPRPRLLALAAGLLTAYAAVIELSVAPVAAVLGIYLLCGAVARGWPTSTILTFALGAFGPTLVLLGYNLLAFGSPFDIGYTHHFVPRFRAVHGGAHPLGLRAPRWELVQPLLIGGYRGLIVHAPILALAPLGWAAMLAGRRWGVAIVTLAVCVGVFLVNLSYPEWSGGWSTGPRLLVPLLPFAMLAVAAALGAFERWATAIAIALTFVGWAEMLMFQGVGGRIPDTIGRPFVDVVWPHWRGDPVPESWPGGRFDRNLVSTFWPGVNDPKTLAPNWQWLQFLPLVAIQAVSIGGMWFFTRTVETEGHPQVTQINAD